MSTVLRPRVGLFLATLAAAIGAAVGVMVPAGAQGAGCDIVGTAGPDVLTGTDADEVICGLGGDDVIDGGGGDDRLIGGPGDDVLRGGAGRDVLLGGGGNDDLNGQRGADRLNGQRGADVLEGGPGRDRLLGGGGFDSCADLAGRTRSRSCEGGALALVRSTALWEALDADEFVYSRSQAPECPDDACIAALTFPAVVHVRGERAVSEDADTPARTAAGLFNEAQAVLDLGGRVLFDPVMGLPAQMTIPDVGTAYLQDVQLRDELRASHDAALETWNNGNVEAYSFVFRNICFCPGIVDVRVEVADGVVVSSAPVDEVEPDAWIPEAQTVDDHLARIGDLLDGLFISVDASFDAETGVPTGYGFDQSRLIADEELSVVISEFAPVPFTIDEPAEDAAETPDGADDGALAIVDVQGIRVNTEIADSLAALLDAASADGFTLSGGGFRDPAAQIALRRANCGTSEFAIWEMPASQCSPPTARPGQSLHETGLAVDFTNDGSLITSRTEPAFIWLLANAASHGFFNHPAEPWHWSINGN